jgi:hypothetical protein
MGMGKRTLVRAVAVIGSSLPLLFGIAPGCGRDFVATVPPPCPFTGITRADRGGNLLGAPDADDWCAASVSDSTTGLWFAWPNPTPDSVTIRFSLAESSDVGLAFEGPGCGIYYYSPEVLRFPPGIHDYVWDCRYPGGGRVAAGIFRVYFTAGSFQCQGDIDIRDP